jgi:hypothetical protein
VKPRKTHGLGVDCVSMISKGQTTIKPLLFLLKCNAFPLFLPWVTSRETSDRTPLPPVPACCIPQRHLALC